MNSNLNLFSNINYYNKLVSNTMQIFKTFFFRHPVQLYRSTTNCFCKRYVAPASPAAQQCTQVRFLSFPSVRFTTAAVIVKSTGHLAPLCSGSVLQLEPPSACRSSPLEYKPGEQKAQSAPSNLALIRPTPNRWPS